MRYWKRQAQLRASEVSLILCRAEPCRAGSQKVSNKAISKGYSSHYTTFSAFRHYLAL